MTYSILLLGVTTALGRKVAELLALHVQDFARVAVFISPVDVDAENKPGQAPDGLESISGSLNDPEFYKGFDIVVSAIGHDLCAAQKGYLEAAIAGGAKHFYPAEHGADLASALARKEPYFAKEILVREYLEAQVQANNILGYTYIMTGIRADLLLDANLLGLSKDKRVATNFAEPDVKVSVTHSDDIARVIVTSLLPRHLDRLDQARNIRLVGSTLSTSALYDAVSYVLHRPIDVTYLPGLPLHAGGKGKPLNNVFDFRHASLQRVLASGAFAVEELDSPGQSKAIVNSEMKYTKELKSKSWAQIVHEYFKSG